MVHLLFPIVLQANFPTAVGAAKAPDDIVVYEFAEFLASYRTGQQGGQCARWPSDCGSYPCQHRQRSPQYRAQPLGVVFGNHVVVLAVRTFRLIHVNLHDVGT